MTVDVGRLDRVPVEPLRKAYERSGLSAAEVARRAGFFKRTSRGVTPDGGRVTQDLGVRAVRTRGGEPYRRTTVGYEIAVRYVRALELDPVDVGV